MGTYSIGFVCLMGIGTVFFGLISLILLTKLMSRLCGAAAPSSHPSHGTKKAVLPEDDQLELLAMISAVIAEDLGTDVAGIRIRSIKKI